ncbi:exodeoxyribonuclease VII small subunit [Rhodoferax sp.]|uniref:exodeoxyribonuclease VII small subunit n=1 Tax=Rhodoferax sp. TaxID=50421 RepID=UPI0025F53A1A|nr:exodeoxyribonuclease VII small subunit [Rhodoferax sp.]
MATKSFKDAYGVLQKNAQKLRDQQEPNIDELLTIVTQSVDAYKVCQERIDAVEKALEHALGDKSIKAAIGGGAKELGFGKSDPSGSDFMQPDDIPF